MVKHVIIWTLKEGYSDEEKSKIKSGIKNGIGKSKNIKTKATADSIAVTAI